MATPSSACPVPTDQRPLNEYKSLQDSWFFGWSSADLKTFVRSVAIWYGIGCIISGPIAAVSFDPADSLSKFLVATSGGSTFLMGLVFLRLYLGWSYVYRRLYATTVDYEETGWYDGQSWTKPEAELTQDRLVCTYQILPILQRLKYSFGVLGLLCMLGNRLWGVF